VYGKAKTRGWEKDHITRGRKGLPQMRKDPTTNGEREDLRISPRYSDSEGLWKAGRALKRLSKTNWGVGFGRLRVETKKIQGKSPRGGKPSWGGGETGGKWEGEEEIAEDPAKLS